MSSSPTSNRNRLGSEKSPYLRQHAENPVWWFPWGTEAFEEARRRDVPVFLSVGYSTCHWCHVMEKESFEDGDVAKALNNAFVAIKVDREERPDVDNIYMDAVHAMRNQGGWPMSVFMTPDGEPFFGGTYFPKEHFLQVIEQIRSVWKSDRDRIVESGQKLTEFLKRQEFERLKSRPDCSVFAKFVEQAELRFDDLHGGHDGAPKFPPAYQIRTLLRIHRRAETKKSDRILQMVQLTLDEMARGGIYDHLGGGFHRYSTDELWLVPHFEKMLYDQSALTLAYLEAFQVTKKKEYELVVRETLDYILREMTGTNGGFYSAEDADSEGEEGKFYVWSEAELREHLMPEEFSAMSQDFEVSVEGNFENRTNILRLIAKGSRETRNPVVAQAMKKLKGIRDKRVRPHLDNKVIVEWNSLMASAMAQAGAVLGENRYVEGATRAMEFVKKCCISGSQLKRRWIDGEAKFDATVEDYAFAIDAAIEVYQATFDTRWLDWACELQESQNEVYWDSKDGGYFQTTESDKNLIRRTREFQDNVIPAGNSMSLLNLLRLADYTYDKDLKKRAEDLIDSLPLALDQYPSAFSQLMMGLDYYLDSSKEVAIVGKKDDSHTQNLIRAFHATYQPNLVVAWKSDDSESKLKLLGKKTLINGKPAVYVCEDGACQLPTSDLSVASKQATSFEPYSF